MRLNHLTLVVEDPKSTQSFLIDVFGLAPMGEGSATMVGLKDESGFTLVLMRGKGRAPVEYPAGFHLGFAQTDKDAVDRIHAAVLAYGVEAPDPDATRGGYQFYFMAPGNVLVEVSC